MNHPHLLEIAAWPWLTRLSARLNRQVTLADVPAHTWDAIARQGFDYVYLMGVWERSPIGRQIARAHSGLCAEYGRALPGWTAEDVPGSPYCISNYVPDTRMGGWSGLDEARAALHHRGMRLVVDFVPNHTGFDHPWVAEHPDWYVQGGEADLGGAPDDYRRVGNAIIACGRDPHFPPWTDVAQLNAFNPHARAALIDVLRTIAQHADGVRCDMAMLLLNDVFERTWRRALHQEWPAPADEFWTGATAAVPSLMYLAEVYWDLEWTLQQQGFDYTYDKRLLDRLHAGSASAVRDHLRADHAYQRRLARFLENHDEARSSVTFGPRTAAAATLLTLPGMRLLFDGQTDGVRTFAPVQLGRWVDEPVDPDVRRLYDRLLAVAREPLFHDGEWRLLSVESAGDDSFEHLIAWAWRQQAALAVIVVNISAVSAQGHVRLDDRAVAQDRTFDDRLTGEHYGRSGDTLRSAGLYVRLAAGAAHVFSVR